MDIRQIVEETLVAPARALADAHNRAQQPAAVSIATLNAATDRIAKLEKVLREIVDEYHDTYDADCDDAGRWKAAASIPVDVMERAAALLK